MNSQHSPAQVAVNLEATADRRLRGRWLIVARVTWVAVALLTLSLIVASVPVRFGSLRSGQIYATLEQTEAGEIVLSPTPDGPAIPTCPSGRCWACSRATWKPSWPRAHSARRTPGGCGISCASPARRWWILGQT